MPPPISSLTAPERPPLTPQAEDYLKALYHLGQSGTVNTQHLADERGVSAASTTAMLRKLSEQGLVDHIPYRGAALTPLGEKLALEVLRHHRLLELFLTRTLGYSWDEVHAEADRLEHVISEQMEARIAQLLGDPNYDPHGHPIPRLDGTMPEVGGRPLTEFTPDSRVVLCRVQGENTEFLRYLTAQGLAPGSDLHLTGIDPLGGTLSLSVGGQTRVLGLETARRLWAESAPTDQQAAEPSSRDTVAARRSIKIKDEPRDR